VTTDERRPGSAAASGGDRFLAEILGQPAAIRRCGAGLADQGAALRAVAEAADTGDPLVFTGMGGSFDAAIAASAWLAGEGIAAAVRPTSELVHFGRPLLRAAGLVIIVSQSGESAEVVRLAADLAAAARAGRRVIAVTNAPRGALAAVADAVVDIRAGEERGPSSMTFATTIVALDAIARAIAGRDGTPATRASGAATAAAADAERAAGCMDRLLSDGPALADALADRVAGRRSLVVVGRGTGLAAAGLGALVVKESTGIPAESDETAEFRHGPIELAGPDLAAVIVATETATAWLDVALAAELLAAGAGVVLISADGAGPDGVLRVAVGDPGRLVAPAVAAAPLQLLAWRLAVRAGREPGVMLRGAKVTRRE
jgi:glucosamine--fructose-6-phosphate aminotransferase (isomerizing)